MLLGEYFTIQDRIEEENSVIFSVALNPSYKVYKGHFPDMPVAPGVCNIQMIKECVQQETGKKLLLKRISQCKFLSVIIPAQNSELFVRVQITETGEESYKIKATITNPENTVSFVDLKGELEVEK